MIVSNSILTSDVFFASGICTLLSKELIEKSFFIVDLDLPSGFVDAEIFPSDREIIAFASNDISFYKSKKLFSVPVLDKKSSLQNILHFFLTRSSTACYRVKSHLTQREHEMLELMDKGLNNVSVADILGITSKTFYTHRRNLMMKLGCDNRIVLQSLFTSAV